MRYFLVDQYAYYMLTCISYKYYRHHFFYEAKKRLQCSFFPGHVLYLLYSRDRFVTRFSRIGLNAIHEGWRVACVGASRARYRPVREMRPAVPRARATRSISG